jgi:predicted N-acyltransferase
LINFKIYNKVQHLPGSWNALPTNDLFLKTDFLKGLEQSYPKNITAYYVGVFKSEKLVGVAIIQRVEMYIDNVFRRTSTNYFKHLAKKLISKIVKGNALVVGNLMHTGQHGLFFISEDISQEAFLQEVYKAINKLTVIIKKTFNKKIRIVTFKDYFEDDSIHDRVNFFKSKSLYKAQAQPNMMFSADTNWMNMDDYCSALTKKYRRRYKTARNRVGLLENRELNLNDLHYLSSELFRLYKNVSDNARVNSFILPHNHFVSFKENLGERFKVFGYFQEDKLIGFYSLVLNNDILETYFLGYDQQLQRKHQMYLNMLYNMVDFAIQNNFKTVVYARTAMEIKSSIGAKPFKMYIYVKHANNIIANTVLSLIVKYMNPLRKWEERHPFKT